MIHTAQEAKKISEDNHPFYSDVLFKSIEDAAKCGYREFSYPSTYSDIYVKARIKQLKELGFMVSEAPSRIIISW